MFDSWVHPQWALGGFFHCCPFTGRVEGCCGGDQSCLSQRGWGTIKALGWEWARAHRSAPVLDTCDDLMVGGDVTAKCWGILERISAMGPDIPSTSPAWRRVCSGLERESELKDTSPLFSAFSCVVFYIFYHFKILDMSEVWQKGVRWLRWGGRWGFVGVSRHSFSSSTYLQITSSGVWLGITPV